MRRPYLISLSAKEAARAQHIQLAQLQPILEVIGAQDISIAEIPSRIREFIESARARAAEPVRPSNDGADIERVIEVSRQKLGDLDATGALAILQAKIDEVEEAQTRRLIPLLKELATVERLAFDHESAKATLLEIVQSSPEDIGANIELGDIWRATGNLENAIEAYRAAGRAASRAGDQRGMSISHNRIGGALLSQGDRRGALDEYRAALVIAETRVGLNSDDTAWLRNLSASHIRIGDVLVSEGDRNGATKAYQTSLVIAGSLAKTDPTHSEWQRDLSICHDRIGNLLISQGDLREGYKAYAAALGIREALAERDPANAQWQRDLSVSHSKMGDILELQRDLENALAAYRTALTIRSALANRDPANMQWQRDVLLSYNRIGDVLELQGNHDAALASHRAAIAIANRSPGVIPLTCNGSAMFRSAMAK